MFEAVTEYNKEIFCKSFKVYYKFFSKYNPKRNLLLMIACFILATISLILEIVNPERFHAIYASAFFYIESLIFLYSLITMRDKGIERKVDKFISKNPNMDLIVKYVFNDENFIAISKLNSPSYYAYDSIVHFERFDDYIIILLKGKKFIALKENNELIHFLQEKVAVK